MSIKQQPHYQSQTIFSTLYVLAALGFLGTILLRLLPAKAKDKKVYRYQKAAGLLTARELLFYKELQTIAKARRWTICPKVRLADIIQPLKGQGPGAFSKIAQKHVDFVLCDPSGMKPVLIVELDDKTHDLKERQERDRFVDGALRQAGLTVMHVRSAKELLEKLRVPSTEG